MSRRRRIVLFDWVSGGHHPVYLRRFAEALEPSFEVVLAVPDDGVAALHDLSLEMVSLGASRPAPPPARSASWALRSALKTEAQLLRTVAGRARPDHLVHMYGDTVLPRLTTSRLYPAPVTIVLFYPRVHYPALYQSPLTPTERLRAWMKEGLLQAWRRRRDANAVLTLDEGAARRWARTKGAPAHWLPEPPVPALRGSDGLGDAVREGCVLYGALAERKGIDLLARAVALDGVPLHVALAGSATPEFLPRLERYVGQMRASGASVEVRAHQHTELEGLRALAGGRCAVLPYPAHDGMSRVLLEAASVGTPVVVHDRGLLGHLVRRHGLGLAVDCTDPRALRDGIAELTRNSARAADFSEALGSFAARYSRDAFERACLAPFSSEAAPDGRGGSRLPASAGVR